MFLSFYPQTQLEFAKVSPNSLKFGYSHGHFNFLSHVPWKLKELESFAFLQLDELMELQITHFLNVGSIQCTYWISLKLPIWLLVSIKLNKRKCNFICYLEHKSTTFHPMDMKSSTRSSNDMRPPPPYFHLFATNIQHYILHSLWLKVCLNSLCKNTIMKKFLSLDMKSLY